MKIQLVINDQHREIEIAANETLLDMLRREGLTGTKRVCESGECGACAVILDGRAVDACILLAAQTDGREVFTIEGFGDALNLHPVQEAFADNGAIQCGFCIPGMIVTAVNFLEENPDPTEDEVRHVFIGNLCRCTGYVKPVEAVLNAARSGQRSVFSNRRSAVSGQRAMAEDPTATPSSGGESAGDDTSTDSQDVLHHTSSGVARSRFATEGYPEPTPQDDVERANNS